MRLLAFVHESVPTRVDAVSRPIENRFESQLPGVYAFFAANDPSVLQFKPVLTVTDDEIDEIITIVQRTFPG